MLRLHAFAKGSHFGGAGAKRLRGQARFRGGRAFVSQMLSVGRGQTRQTRRGSLSKTHKAYRCLLCKVLLNCDQSV